MTDPSIVTSRPLSPDAVQEPVAAVFPDRAVVTDRLAADCQFKVEVPHGTRPGGELVIGYDPSPTGPHQILFQELLGPEGSQTGTSRGAVEISIPLDGLTKAQTEKIFGDLEALDKKKSTMFGITSYGIARHEFIDAIGGQPPSQAAAEALDAAFTYPERPIPIGRVPLADLISLVGNKVTAQLPLEDVTADQLGEHFLKTNTQTGDEQKAPLIPPTAIGQLWQKVTGKELAE